MSMTDTPIAPSPKRKPRRKAAPKAAKPADELAGLTVTECPKSCGAERCVISGIGVCAHPRKGGLQSSSHNPGALERLNRAQKMVGKRLVDVRFS